MSIPLEELAEIAKVLEAVRPYLGDLVLIGGWAHRLFRLHPLARPVGFEPLTTEDVDFAVPQEVKQRDAEPLSKLLESAEFEPVHKSIHSTPPVVRYQGKDGLLVEFVANLEGGTYDRSGKSKDVLEVAGVTAELLRYVYPLQISPWTPAEQAEHPILSEVRIANPVGYLFQKILVNRRRRTGKGANDLLYVADTADIFGDRLEVPEGHLVLALGGPEVRWWAAYAGVGRAVPSAGALSRLICVPARAAAPRGSHAIPSAFRVDFDLPFAVGRVRVPGGA